MTIYRRLLAAVDLTEDSPHIAAHAKRLAEGFAADLDLLHVVEPLPLMVPDAPEVMAPAILQTQDEIVHAAGARLQELAASVGIAENKTHVVIGTTNLEIVRAARERGTDLIILGRRERHGLSLLVDFTEDSVLHKASCDVLAVRVNR
jgi:universal stress protein A